MIWGYILLAAVALVTIGLIAAMFRKPARKSTLARPTDGVSTPVSAPPKPYAEADRLYTEKRYTEAIEAYRDALIKYPKASDWGAARSRLIEALEGAGLSAAAEVERNELIRELNARRLTTGSALVLGRLDKSRGDPYAAYATFERGVNVAAAGAPPYTLMFELSALGPSIGRPDLELYWATRALDMGGGSVRKSLLSMAGNASLTLGDVDAAERYYREELEISRKSENSESLGRSLAHMSRVHGGRGEYDRALELAQQSVGLNPNDTTGLCEMIYAVHLGSLGRYSEAIDILSKAVDRVGSSTRTVERRAAVPLQVSLVAYLISNHEVDRASALYAELPERPEPIHVITRAALGARLAAVRKSPDANDRLRAAFERIENSGMHLRAGVNAVKNIGRGAVEVGNSKLALACARRLQSHPEVPSEMAVSWFYLGEAHRIGGDVDAAREAYLKAVDSGIRNVATAKAASTLVELA